MRPSCGGLRVGGRHAGDRALDPDSIPIRIVADFPDQAGSQGISNNVPGDVAQTFFSPNRVIVKAVLPKSALPMAGTVQQSRGA